MSSIQDRLTERDAARALDDRYMAARAEIERKNRLQQGEAGAVVFAALAYGDALETNGAFRTMAHYAKLFCIGAAFIIPNLLVIDVLL